MARTYPTRSRRSVRLFPLCALVALSACVDAPAAPDGAGLLLQSFVVQPRLTLLAPAATLSKATTDALSAAFDRVDTFRLRVTRAATGAVVAEATVSVTPGQDEYDLSIEASGVAAGEDLLVTVTALEGSTLLFESQPIAVKARPTSSSAPPPTVDVPLVYAGPGVTATEITVAPGVVALAPSGTVTMGAAVKDASGATLAGVPLAWSAEDAGVASVSSGGQITAGSTGRTRVTASTPTGLTASAWVYVVAGEMAYVRDGGVVVRDVVGTSEAQHGSGTLPAWSPDGSRLLVDRGGTVTDALSGTAYLEGTSPAMSPDQTKLVAERGGTLVFANADGTTETSGPAGSHPVWANGAELLVAGGSIERVRADGSGRTTVVSGAARWPALSGAGQVAYVLDGALHVDGGSALLTGVDSRPTWSTDGQWLVASAGGDLHLVPVDGGSPAVSLGAAGATFPAWKGSGTPAQAPSSLLLTGLDPEQPAPGAPAVILGSGFDWIIPGNNRVFFPGPEGDVEATVLGVTEATLRVLVPNRVAKGTIRVATWTEQATIAFEPALGSVAVAARTPWGTGVKGVTVRLLDGTGVVATAVTDDEGSALLASLDDGAYSLSWRAPTGFSLTDAPTAVTVAAGTATSVEAVLTPLIQAISITPEDPTLKVGESVDVTLTALDINGNAIEEFSRSTWLALSSDIAVGGRNLKGTLRAVHPSGAELGGKFRVILNDQIFTFSATVRSAIKGFVGRPVDSSSSAAARVSATELLPAPSITVELLREESVVARTTTNGEGRFAFDDLLGGSYTVRLSGLGEDESAQPQSLHLGAGNPSPDLTFSIKKASAAAGDLVVVNDWNIWDSNRNGPPLVQNLVASAPNEGTKVVWWCGRQANPSGTALSKGICNASINSDGSGQFRGTRDNITDAGWTFEVDYQSPLTAIGDDVRVFWLWTPTEQLTNAEVNVLKAFAARGGRIVFNADFKESWYSSSQHADIATRLFGQLGANITSIGQIRSGSVIAAPDHPILQGISSVQFGAPGDMTVAAPALALVTDASGNVLMAYQSGLDTSPLPLETSTSPAAVRIPSRIVPVSPLCTPGTVCPPPASSEETDRTDDREGTGVPDAEGAAARTSAPPVAASRRDRRR